MFRLPARAAARRKQPSRAAEVLDLEQEVVRRELTGGTDDDVELVCRIGIGAAVQDAVVEAQLPSQVLGVRSAADEGEGLLSRDSGVGIESAQIDQIQVRLLPEVRGQPPGIGIATLGIIIDGAISAAVDPWPSSDDKRKPFSISFA